MKYTILAIFACLLITACGGKPQVNLGLSFALVPSNEDYFISTSGYNVPKPSIFKVEPVPSHEMPPEDHKDKGVLEFVKSSIDKSVQAIKDLVSPSTDKPTYIQHPPKSYSLDEPASFTTPAKPSSSGQFGVFVPQLAPSNYLASDSLPASLSDSQWKRKQEIKPSKKINPVTPKAKKKAAAPASLKSTFAPTKAEIDRRPIVYFDITIDGVPAGTVFFELFNETVPKTAENFRILTLGDRGYGYKNSIFHRIVPGYIVQGGDFTSKDGNGQMSIYGGRLFEDENFLVPHDSPGMLSMANEGPDSNGSQFFITVTKLNKLDGKHVVFGRVHDETSYALVEKINRECGSENGKATKIVKIINTGQFR